METECRIWTHFSPKQLSLLVHSPLRLASGSIPDHSDRELLQPPWEHSVLTGLSVGTSDSVCYIWGCTDLCHTEHMVTLRHTQTCKHLHSQMTHKGSKSQHLQKKWVMLPQAIPDQCAEKRPVWPRKDSLGDVQSSCLHRKKTWFRHQDKLHEGFQNLEE